mgnify:CR=1 FL=1
MEICISNDVLGSDKHLVFDADTQTYTTTTAPPDGSWFVGGHHANCHDVSELLTLMNKEIRLFPNGRAEKYFQSIKELYPQSWESSNIKWAKYMPKDYYLEWVKSLVDEVRSSLNSGWCDYYSNTFKCNSALLDSLERGSVNVARLNKYLEETEHETLRANLKSFVPQDDGLCSKVNYLRSSATGRLTVKSGPRILTLAKKHRDIIASRYAGGTIMMIDYKCLEARIALSMTGRAFDLPEDIYAFLSTKLFADKLSRATVKLITLSRLFGATNGTISEKTGLVGTQLNESVESIDDYFDIKNVTAKLISSINDGHIQNAFGRPLFVKDEHDHVVYCYYIQSSGVDIALAGFHSIVDTIRSKSIRIKPLFVLHDAMFFDCDVGTDKTLIEISSTAGASTNQFSNIRFYTSNEVINGDN